eukprot:m.37125 g.37125  ORF g.37125 m.37125 type:complete len:166 (-) comp11507_c0_seq1:91-588(-)
MRSIDELNSCSYEQFAAFVGELFEPCSVLTEGLFRLRPFPSHAFLVDDALRVFDALTDDERVQVLAAHPAIGAPKQTLSTFSKAEQSHGTPEVPPEVLERLRILNEQYKSKFGFSYVVFVNKRSRAALLPEFEQRLQRTRDVEMKTGLEAMVHIARARLDQMRSH